MPKITMYGQEYICEQGANLREFLLNQGVQLYNGKASLLNWHGHSSCGTCAVGIRGEVSQPTASEKFRLAVAPFHGVESDRRLACQVNVLGDIEVTKYDGFFGEGTTPVTDTKAPVQA